jgi:hypothetical protein
MQIAPKNIERVGVAGALAIINALLKGKEER